MTLRDGGNMVVDIDSLDFSQSNLFKPAQEKESWDNLDFGDSILFGQVGFDLGKGKDSGSSDSNENPTTRGVKTVKLINGKTIQLKPREKKLRSDDDMISGSFMNMDELFNKAELRNNIKRNNEKLKQLNYFEPSKSKSTQMWTEKYRPSRFIDLCSAGNDKQYRLIFQWLKRWSGSVFKDNFVPDQTTDSLGRPHKKILLVHGPTGLGKTAAIHISLKQFGYSVQELNAANSMDTIPQAANEPSNSSYALKLKIMNALTSNSISSNGKPSCLIIDEIDSAFNAREIIKVLNDLIHQDRIGSNSKLSNQNDDQIPKKKNTKKKMFILNRPIICIANDLYANNTGKYGPSPMDKLRPLCEVVAFRKPMSTKNKSGKLSSGNAIRSVKDHLMWICKQESLSIDYKEIGEIVEICEGDLRACINHLQFNGRVSLKQTTKDSNAYKDKQLSWYSIIDLLFKRDSQLTKDENFDQLLQLLMDGNGKSVFSSNSTLDKVIKGCFNKYLDVVYSQDDSLIKPALLSDWLGVYETFSSNSNNVTQYSSLVSLKFWSLFSELNPNRNSDVQPLIENAKSIDFESYETAKMNKTTIKTIVGKLPISLNLALGNNLEVFSCYFLPYLNKYFNPDLSSKTLSGLRNSERLFIEKVALIIKAFGLTLETERDIQSGLTTLEISPNWETITNFDSEFAPISIRGLNKHIQQSRQRLFPLLTAEFEKLNVSKSIPKRIAEANTLNEEKKKRLKLGSSIEFFKQKYQVVSLQTKETKDLQSSKDSRIWVKYNEGFSNAVRKTITWNDIWVP